MDMDNEGFQLMEVRVGRNNLIEKVVSGRDANIGPSQSIRKFLLSKFPRIDPGAIYAQINRTSGN